MIHPEFDLSQVSKWRVFMSRYTNLMLMLVFAILASGLFSAMHAAQKGSETKGRHFFKDNCRQCHTKGAVGGDVTPMNKTMAQWRAYFAAGTHNHGKEPLTKYLPADQLLDSSAFLINHAADSPQPETCGK
jgi:mono/diheme cytochrome c family protein